MKLVTSTPLLKHDKENQEKMRNEKGKGYNEKVMMGRKESTKRGRRETG
jgi:hypothetical protein